MTPKETEQACLSVINSLAAAAKALEMAAGVIKKMHREAVYPNLKVVKTKLGDAPAKEIKETEDD